MNNVKMHQIKTQKRRLLKYKRLKIYLMEVFLCVI